ncbi:hypothetical protein EVAR_49849_1, partial [Eumeta japonica]
EFKRGRTNLTDDLREGCTYTATTKDYISSVRLMTGTDKRVTYKQIQISLVIGMRQMHKHLAAGKFCTSVDTS